MNKLIKGLHILSWIPLAIIKLILFIVGLFFIPLFLINRNQYKYELDGRYFSSMWWLWDNKEEGCPDWWIKKSKQKNWVAKTFPRWWWFAIRNPVNGFRYIFKDRQLYAIETNVEGESIEPEELIKQQLTSGYMWRSSGPFGGYRKVWLSDEPGLYSEIWFGWKVGSEVDGMGFTMQVRLNREIGK